MAAKSKEKKLLSLVYNDELTNLFNRRYLKEVIPGYLTQAKKEGFLIACYMIDLDQFKDINDTYGHDIGDKALIHFSEILSNNVKGQGIAIRYAGDEFVIVLSNVEQEKAREIGTNIIKNVTETPLKFDGNELTLACSIGISMFPKDSNEWEMLFKKADEALYTAKRQGKGRVITVPDSGKLLTPFKLDSILASPYIVGRDDIIQFLDKHISEQGNPSEFPVFMGGEGTGKTRLIEYAQEVAKKKSAFSLFAKGYPLWQTESYGAVFTAIGGLFEEQQSISDEVFSKLDDKYKQILKPHLYPWDVKELAMPEEAAEPDSLALFEALTQIFVILREKGDGVILLDAADQIDSPSLQFFDSQFSQKDSNNLYFVSSITCPDRTTGDEKLLLILESMSEVAAHAKAQKFQLEALRLEHIQELAVKLFDEEKLPSESAETLLRNSGGNPRFIVEALSHLLLESKIVAAGDKWDLSPVKPEDIPESLSDMIKVRLLRMDKEQINVLKLASILGEKINPKQLAEISELKLQHILKHLNNARRVLLIEETPNPNEFIFSHRVDRSVFYSLMSEEERRKYHIIAAEIERKYAAGSLERVVGKLAYHFQNAGILDKAAEMFTTLKENMNAVAISKGLRKTLQRRIVTSSMAKESALEEEDILKAIEILRAFRAALQNLRLYPKEHKNVEESVGRFMELVEPFLTYKTEALSIAMTSETTLFNGQPAPPRSLDRRLTEELYQTLNNYGLQGVLLIRGLNQEEAVRFFEAFQKSSDEVASQWDRLVDQLNLSHILPDRKMFVAVGERKIVLDDQEVFAQTPGRGAATAPAQSATGATPMSDEQLEQLNNILDQFRKEKEELLSSLRSGDINKQELQELVELLKKTDISRIDRTVMEAHRAATPGAISASPQKDRYADVQPDLEIVKQAEEDISLAFEDLNSQDTTTRAKAAAWLAKQETSKLAEFGMKMITSDKPLKTRRLAAGTIQKAGEDAVEALLKKINKETPLVPLLKMIEVADIFIKNPKLIRIIRDIVLTGQPEAVPAAIEILKQVPGTDVNPIILELFDSTVEKFKLDILNLFAKRGMVEAVPVLLEIIKPKKIWEKENRVPLQAQACRTLGLLGSPHAADYLIAVAISPKPWTLQKSKPDSVRVAATWALAQLPKTGETNKALDRLKKDKSPLVRKATRA
ncbi:MAG: diguanylate cyclase [Candidatus Aminicenantes bacterium]|nr:MAG: diguanylate cyclase [Candidatus Aminicenantes bacterium]